MLSLHVSAHIMLAFCSRARRMQHAIHAYAACMQIVCSAHIMLAFCTQCAFTRICAQVAHILHLFVFRTHSACTPKYLAVALDLHACFYVIKMRARYVHEVCRTRVIMCSVCMQHSCKCCYTHCYHRYKFNFIPFSILLSHNFANVQLPQSSSALLGSCCICNGCC